MKSIPQLNLFDPATLPLLTPDEIYEKADQAILEKLQEDRRIERKLATVSLDHLGEYFLMWANTVPEGGLLLVGYDNDGSISGCLSVGQTKINEMEKCGRIYAPEARFDTKRISVQLKDAKEDYALLIRVFYRQDKVVRTVKGEAFIRKGDSKYRLTDDEIRELEIDKRQIDFEREPCGLSYPSDFDMDLVRQYAKNYKFSRQLTSPHTNEDILKINHLGTIESAEFIPNNACALLFAKDPQQIFSGCKIRFFRFDGEEEYTGEKWNVIKDIWVDSGSIPKQILEIEGRITAQLRDFSRLEADGKFYTAPEYPKEAWYEAIVNACVHRSYSQRAMNIFVKMFDDRLIIESPGGFPPLVTPANIYDTHNPRNPYLMNAMYYLDFVKCAHEGTRRIRDSMIASKLPNPEFRQETDVGSVVKVILRNNVKHRKVWIDKDASSAIGAVLWGSLSDDERRIINWIAEYGEISVSQVQRITSKSWPASSKLLKGLKQKGIIEDQRTKTDRDPQARWILVKPKK